MTKNMACGYILQILFSKKLQICYGSTTTEPREKISPGYESLELYKCFEICRIKIKNNQILCNKMCRRFQVTTKLFTG
jgi:hypothetical protein